MHACTITLFHANQCNVYNVQFNCTLYWDVKYPLPRIYPAQLSTTMVINGGIWYLAGRCIVVGTWDDSSYPVFVVPLISSAVATSRYDLSMTNIPTMQFNGQIYGGIWQWAELGACGQKLECLKLPPQSSIHQDFLSIFIVPLICSDTAAFKMVQQIPKSTNKYQKLPKRANKT